MKRRDGYLIAAAGTALVLASTLWPDPGSSQQAFTFWCFLCGSRDGADSLLNLLLFVPLGSGLTILGGPALAVGGSLALSGMVEMIQVTLPGRHPSLADILANTLGGAAGCLVMAVRTHGHLR